MDDAVYITYHELLSDYVVLDVVRKTIGWTNCGAEFELGEDDWIYLRYGIE